MTDLHDLLERADRALSESVPTTGDSFGDLDRRRDRRTRNRRIRAGVLGVVVALATGLVLARSLTSAPIPADPPVEPAKVVSGALVYADDGKIYVADPDGTNPVLMADPVALGHECPNRFGYALPSWSPNGRFIAFRASLECSPETAGVVIIDPQGNVVATFPAEVSDGITWSPDSTRVAVWEEYGRIIGIHGIDGTSELISTPPGWEPRTGPVYRDWTPDGASMIVNELELPVDGGTPRELPFPAARSGSPHDGWVHYSPDGSQVAYTTERALMVARSDGSEPREVFGDGPSTTAWSPTGGLIAVTADPPGAIFAHKLFLVEVATGSADLLFEGPPDLDIQVIGFSPEGDRILVMGIEDSGRGPGSLWSVAVDGSDARVVLADNVVGAFRPI